MDGVTDDAVLGGRLRLLQPQRGHRVGHDAILLAAATTAVRGERVVEFGAGVGAAGLALAVRAGDVAVTLVELDAELAALAAENARRNGLVERVQVVNLDVCAPPRAFAAAGLKPGAAARVMMNPPFNDPARQRSSPERGRRLAHAARRAPQATLAAWIGAATRLLRSGGVLTLIWRADGLADALAALGPAYGGIAVLPVHPKPQAPAIRVLLRAAKGSKAPLELLPGLVLNDTAGRASPDAEAILRHGRLLPLADR
jgi:tRNA1(Val) A37 N6-methylase TrmN6